jgi:S-formylglutathione hydrolase FrmB
MSFLSAQFFGKSIVKQASMYVVLPPGKGPFPVLYLLHGLSDDHTIWHRRTSIERYVEGRNLIVVMPDGGRSFYCNDPRPAGLAYEDHMANDVVEFVDQTFPTIATRRGRAVAGLSMGGYGATMLALRHPDVFCAACSHSGAVGFCHSRHDINGIDPADILPRERYDCHRLAAGLLRARSRKIKNAPPMPALRIDCGTEDFLLDENRAFHAHLAKLGVEHVYEEYPGEHTWEYWDEHIRQSLDFVLERLAGTVHRA